MTQVAKHRTPDRTLASWTSEGIVTVKKRKDPPSSIFWKKEVYGGVTVKNFFLKDFLSKKFFRREAPEKEGGVSVALPPDQTPDME